MVGRVRRTLGISGHRPLDIAQKTEEGKMKRMMFACAAVVLLAFAATVAGAGDIDLRKELFDLTTGYYLAVAQHNFTSAWSFLSREMKERNPSKIYVEQMGQFFADTPLAFSVLDVWLVPYIKDGIEQNVGFTRVALAASTKFKGAMCVTIKWTRENGRWVLSSDTETPCETNELPRPGKRFDM